MKVLHLVNHLNTGGITTYVRTLAAEQVKAGHEVFVWGKRGTRSEDLKSLGIRLIEDVPCCKSELSPRLWAMLPKLVRVLKTRSIGILHAHTRTTQVLSSVASALIKIPYITTAHMFYKRRLGRRLFPCWGKTVIAISKVMEQGLQSIFKPEELPPIAVVPNGVDAEALLKRFKRVDRARVREGYGYGQNDLVLLSLCRLIPVKGIHFLIEAFAVARGEVPDLKLLLAGDGDPDYIRSIKARVLELKLVGDVLFIGNEPEIEKPLCAADIFAAPYLWPEAFGLSVLEAMVVGLPVAGSLSGGVVELLGQGKYGLLFERENISDLAQCLIRYAKDAALRAQMGQAAGKAALEYTSVKMYERVQKVYESIPARES